MNFYNYIFVFFIWIIKTSKRNYNTDFSWPSSPTMFDFFLLHLELHLNWQNILKLSIVSHFSFIFPSTSFPFSLPSFLPWKRRKAWLITFFFHSMKPWVLMHALSYKKLLIADNGVMFCETTWLSDWIVNWNMYCSVQLLGYELYSSR